MYICRNVACVHSGVNLRTYPALPASLHQPRGTAASIPEDAHQRLTNQGEPKQWSGKATQSVVSWSEFMCWLYVSRSELEWSSLREFTQP